MREHHFITTTNLWRNASFILKTIAKGQDGETVAIICDDASYTNARVLADCAHSRGMKPLLLDIAPYATIQFADRYQGFPFNPAIKAAIEASDISIMAVEQMYTNFGLFLGDKKECDVALLGFNRRYTVDVNGMDSWNIDENEILTMRRRTVIIEEMLRKGRLLRVTTAEGSDFTCEVGDVPGGMYSVLGIVPLYAEVAIVPAMGTANGVAVIDGASQLQSIRYPIRPNFIGGRELDREPLRIEFKDSLVTSYQGDPIQVDRLREWMYKNEPFADKIDEVGIVTTTCLDNNKYHWLIDGTHQARCLHIALGNNKQRGEIIHAQKHIDFDMHDPRIELDGVVLYEHNRFNDEIIFKAKS